MKAGGAGASAGTILWRGVRRRCGRCGSPGIFRGYFRLGERCPACGVRLQREAGAFTGVLLVNIAGTFVLMIVPLFAYVGWRGVTGEAPAFWPFAAACLAFALTPAVLYPVAASTWSAADLAVRPLDPDERDDADRHARPSGPGK